MSLGARWWAIFLLAVAGLAFLASEAVSLTPLTWSHIESFVLLLLLFWLVAIASTYAPRGMYEH